jgi:phage shock protein C
MKKLTRNPQRGSIAGVCHGLGYYFDVDPILVRAAFIMAGLLFAPAAIAAYIALWIVAPKFQPRKK